MLAEKRGLSLPAVLLITAVAVVHVDAQRSCVTARKAPGVCVPKYRCETITTLLKLWPDPPPPQVERYLEMSRCGTLGDIVYMCCEPNRVSAQGPSVTLTGLSQQRQLTTTTSSTTTTTPEPTVETTTESKILKSGTKSDDDIQSGMDVLDSTGCDRVKINRVANGQNAILEEFPWMALLVYDDGVVRTTNCAGSLISFRYVLTAAHCIRRSVKLVSVRLGEHDTATATDCTGSDTSKKCAPPVQEIDVEEAIYHEDYDVSQVSNDIGLIRLVSRVRFRSNVKPICLPVSPESQAVSLSQVQIAGWGRTEKGRETSVLQKAVVVMHENSHCQNIHQLITVTEKHLCAGGTNDIASCEGDSGGPLFFGLQNGRVIRYIQYGIVSAGSSLCGSNFPDVFANVTAYLPWIFSNIRS